MASAAIGSHHREGRAVCVNQRVRSALLFLQMMLSEKSATFWHHALGRARRTLVILAAVALAACHTGMRAGPSDGETRNGATLNYAVSADKVGYNYILVDISKLVNSQTPDGGVMAAGSIAPNATAHEDLVLKPGGPPNVTLGIGDTVQITLFESEAGGLFVPADAGGRQGNSITLPPQQVSRNGAVSIPYAGEVRAAGQSIPALQERIRKRLEDRAIEPQVIVTLLTSASAQVTIMGDVGAPGRQVVDLSGTRIMDALAKAGGLRGTDHEARITLQRGALSKSFRLSELVADATLNAFLQPGDVVYVSADRRSFVAMGASGANGSISFDGKNLTLASAIGKAGGLLDNRADPGFVYLYREVDRKVLEAIGIPLKDHAEQLVPVIYHANLREPQGIFAANHFAMQDNDVLYISNASSYEFSKYITLLNGVATTAANSVYGFKGARTN